MDSILTFGERERENTILQQATTTSKPIERERKRWNAIAMMNTRMRRERERVWSL